MYRHHLFEIVPLLEFNVTEYDVYCISVVLGILNSELRVVLDYGAHEKPIIFHRNKETFFGPLIGDEVVWFFV